MNWLNRLLIAVIAVVILAALGSLPYTMKKTYPATTTTVEKPMRLRFDIESLKGVGGFQLEMVHDSPRDEMSLLQVEGTVPVATECNASSKGQTCDVVIPKEWSGLYVRLVTLDSTFKRFNVSTWFRVVPEDVQ